MSFRILFQDEHLVAIDKPAGFHVHPPEDPRHSISKAVNCLYLLRKQLNAYVYPVHRLDRATSGVMLFGLSSESARLLCQDFQSHKIMKTYYCVVRGWTQDSGKIDHPLKAESSDAVVERIEALTHYETLAKVELPISVGKYPSSRYSLVKVVPKTGRKHQIRRHFAHLSHPLIGDTIYGNGEHNRLFKDRLDLSGLHLKAHVLEFVHPFTGSVHRIESRWTGRWHKVFDLFGFCPITQSVTTPTDGVESALVLESPFEV